MCSDNTTGQSSRKRGALPLRVDEFVRLARMPNTDAPCPLAPLTGDETRLFRGTRHQLEGNVSGKLPSDDRMPVRRHFEQTGAASRRAAVEARMPLVVLGTAHLQALYRDVNAFPDLLVPTITGDPADLPPERIHRCAWNSVALEPQVHERVPMAATVRL